MYEPASVVRLHRIRAVGEFRGERIGVLATDIEIALMDRLGHAGIPIPMGDVLPGLNTRHIDGIRAAMNTLGRWAVPTYTIKTHDAQIGGAMFASSWFESPPA